MRSIMMIVLIGALVMSACKTKELLPSEYVKWMKDPANGLRDDKSIGAYTFTLQYKTAEFVLLQQHKSDEVKRTDIESQLGNYTGMEYYTFEIQNKDGHDLLDDQYYDAAEVALRLEYFLSYAQDDFSLVTDNDTLPCALFHFERSYSLSPVTTLVMGFDKADSTLDRTVVYNDRLLGTGPVRITINAGDIQNVPTVKYTHHE